jgi:hypothetical protein
MHRFDEEMVTMNQKTQPTSTCLNDAASHYANLLILMFLMTIRIFGVSCRVYNIKEHWVVLYRDKANLCFGICNGNVLGL